MNVNEISLDIATAPALNPPPDLATPAAYIDLDVVSRNISRMQEQLASRGVGLRPHVKTHKSIEIGRMQLDAGAAGITAGTLGEAEVFAHAGFQDIFIAYPIWASETNHARIRELHEETQLRIGVDSHDGARQLAKALTGSASPLEVVIEVDCGAHRTGIRPNEAGELAEFAQTLGLEAVGVFTYAGHGDASPEAPARAARDEIEALERSIESFYQRNLTPRVASAGTTPTAVLSASEPLTESRPGEYVLNDLNKLRLGVCEPSGLGLFVATTVVSRAIPDQVIVDAGTKALGREGNETKGFGAIPELPGSHLWRTNDYHGFVSIPEGTPRPEVGNVVSVVPNHVCPVINLFDELAVVRDGHVIDTWPVQARGHLS